MGSGVRLYCLPCWDGWRSTVYEYISKPIWCDVRASSSDTKRNLLRGGATLPLGHYAFVALN